MPLLDCRDIASISLVPVTTVTPVSAGATDTSSAAAALGSVGVGAPDEHDCRLVIDVFPAIIDACRHFTRAHPPARGRRRTRVIDGDADQEESGATDVTGVIDAMHAPCETELAHAHVLQIITHPDPSFLSGKSDVHAHTHTH